MNKAIFTLLTFLLSLNIWAQGFNYQLTGNPVNTTGWDYGTMSSVFNNEFVLTTNIANQSGYIYYNTPTNLTECSYFSVNFEFSITNSSSPTADGLAFWYISNPPTGFTGGGGIGLPNNPNGLLLIFDTYDNNSTPDNPLITLRRLDGSGNYVEGSATGRLCPDVTNQNAMTNGSWHAVQMIYDNGTVTVSLNNTLIMSGNTALSNFTGYFGFSAGTGSLWARHAIRNVSITGLNLPEPPGVPVKSFSYCVGDSVQPIVAYGNNLRWYTDPQGSYFDTVPPLVSSAIPGVYTWYVSDYFAQCNYETEKVPVTVTVNAHPVASIEPKDIAICYGDSIPVRVVTIPVSDDHAISWFPAQYLANSDKETNSFFATEGNYTVMVNVLNTKTGCYDYDSISIKIAPKPQIEVYPKDTTVLLGESVQLNAAASDIKTWFWYPTYYLTDPQITNPVASPKDDITYTIYGTNEWGCIGEAKVNIKFTHLENVFIPNAFSPNGDGLNDVFKIIGINYEHLLTFTIHNRYGEIVYNGTNPELGWDGTYKGMPAPMDVYSYNIVLNIPYQGLKQYKGDLTLIR